MCVVVPGCPVLSTAADERKAVEMMFRGKDRGICMLLNLRPMRMLRMSNDSHTQLLMFEFGVARLQRN